MASLSTALNYARSSLSTVAGQTALTSQNISNVNNANYSRRSASVTSQSSGSISISRYDRATSSALLDKLLSSSSTSAGSKAIIDSISMLATTVGDPESGTSPAARLNALQSSLRIYEQNPSDQNLASSAIESARSLAQGLNDASAIIGNVRNQADKDIGESVTRINNLLQQYKVVNDAITRGDISKSDMVDNLDNRDSIIKQLSEEIGIKTISRANGDIALYTDSGVSLFETTPRTVSFKPTPNLAPGTSGGDVYIDGVDITSSSSPMPVQSGNIFGLINIRDKVTVTYQTQMDEFARGLITMFSESDQSAVPSLADATGLFSYSGSPAVPAAGVAIPGLASSIRLSAAVDPTQSGTVSKLRDGGINGASYVYNSTSAAGFSDRLNQLYEAIDGTLVFDQSAQLSTSTSLKTFGSSSSGWLSALQKRATETADLQTATSQRASDALQTATGVSLDDEMAHMLELERSYQASAKLISTVDQMFQTLFGAIK